MSVEESPPAAAAGRHSPAGAAGVVTVRPAEGMMTKQRIPYFVGISGQTAGSHGLCLNLIVIPPGGAAEPHIHRGYETAIYLLEGRVLTRWGANLEHSTINEAGDFLYIPADVPHQPVNLSDTAPARALVARNDANEQETVELWAAT